MFCFFNVHLVLVNDDDDDVVYIIIDRYMHTVFLG